MGRFFQAKVGFSGLLLAAGSIGCACTVTGFLGGLWWLFDLSSHFRLQYAVGLTVLSGLLWLGRKRLLAAMLLTFSIVNWATVAPYCWLGRAPATTNGKALRAMLLNVCTENQRYDLVQRCIRDQKPDLVVIEEVDERWLKELASVRAGYPYSVVAPRSDNFGMALFSRLPLQDTNIIYLGSAEVPSITAKIELGSRVMTILGTHPLPPGSRENTLLRDEQLSAIPTALARKGPVIVLGDLNATPWCRSFQRLLRAVDLRDTARGFGWQATWPAAFLPLRIPIDHCLVSREFGVLRRQVGPAIGSDHLPVMVDIVLNE